LIAVIAYAIGRENNGFDLSDTLVPANEIHLGGPPRDGIPAIDHPRFVSADQATFLEPTDRVLGLRQNGVAKAYPIKILNWHEVVNDRFAEEPVAITYCPLCGTGIAFAAGDPGQQRTFGVSGLLYNSDVLLYDRETESLWSQLLMQAISGSAKGEELTPLPSVHTTWRGWLEEHPDTLVLSTHTGFDRDYEENPYASYDTDKALYFPVRTQSARFHPKERVLGLEIGGQFKAYPYTELARHEKSTFRDTVNGQQITIQFDLANESAQAIDHTGRLLPATTSFWFAWFAFHPETEVFEAAH
jgi:hypothetical protein